MQNIGKKKSPASAAHARLATGSAIEAKPSGQDAPALASAVSSQPLAFRVPNFCERIGISPSTFWKYAASGQIRTIRIGGRTLVPADEAARILREGVQ